MANRNPYHQTIGALTGEAHNPYHSTVEMLDAWHGTPHWFAPTKNNPLGEFDLSKMGSGRSEEHTSELQSH